MKVIDLLDLIADGEIQEDTMFEYSHGNGYKEYCNARQFFNRYIVDKENLNLEILEDKVENKKIEKIPKKNDNGDLYLYSNEALEIINKLNEVIDRINNAN